jgi:hypothetical protein
MNLNADRIAPSPQPSPPMGAREKASQVMRSWVQSAKVSFGEFSPPMGAREKTSQVMRSWVQSAKVSFGEFSPQRKDNHLPLLEQKWPHGFRIIPMAEFQTMAIATRVNEDFADEQTFQSPFGFSNDQIFLPG